VIAEQNHEIDFKPGFCTLWQSCNYLLIGKSRRIFPENVSAPIGIHPPIHIYVLPAGETKLQVEGPAAGNTELSGIHTA